MGLLVQSFFVFLAGILAACGPLPRAGGFGGSLSVLPSSKDVTGLVLTATDESYTSTDIYFYNFATGQLEVLATGESGDVLPRWDGQKLWVFNRATGRVSYSSFSPKVGFSSRSPERRTPGAKAYDPSDMLSVGTTEAILAMPQSNSMSVVNLLNGAEVDHRLTAVDTGIAALPFRPSIVRDVNDAIFVVHQALNATWQANGGGRVYIARRQWRGSWSWIDQDVTTAGIDGVSLNVSNPVAMSRCEEGLCFIAGACYPIMGNSCVGGVDQLDLETKSVQSLYQWPVGSVAAGTVIFGPNTGQTTACLKLASETNARLVSFLDKSGRIAATWDTGSAYCGAIVADPAGGRLFVLQSGGDSTSLVVLDSELRELTQIALGQKISGIEAVNE